MIKPILRAYKPSSVVYVEGDIAEEIYVLRSGCVITNTTDPVKKENIEEIISKGQFFGVRSVLGNHPREETARVVQPTEVLVLNLNAFMTLCTKNTPILIQLLKGFSAKLRNVHNAVQSILGENNKENNAYRFFKIGLHYYKSKQLKYALHVFNKFIQYYPNAPLTEKAKEILKHLHNETDYYDFKEQVVDHDKNLKHMLED